MTETHFCYACRLLDDDEGGYNQLEHLGGCIPYVPWKINVDDDQNVSFTPEDHSIENGGFFSVDIQDFHSNVLYSPIMKMETRRRLTDVPITRATTNQLKNNESIIVHMRDIDTREVFTIIRDNTTSQYKNYDKYKNEFKYPFEIIKELAMKYNLL